MVKNHELGVTALGNATKLTLKSSLVGGTLPSEGNAELGFGAYIVAGAELTLLGTAIVGNHYAGVYGEGTGIEVTINGSLVEGTLPQQSDGKYGTGVGVLNSARLTLGESAIVANHDFGLIVLDAGTAATATGALVEGQDDAGIVIQFGATLTVAGSAVVTNHSVGGSFFVRNPASRRPSAPRRTRRRQDRQLPMYPTEAAEAVRVRSSSDPNLSPPRLPASL